jgi:hypothetical protein
MGIGECQFAALDVAADHPKWWLCGDDDGSRYWSKDVVESESVLEVPGEK